MGILKILISIRCHIIKDLVYRTPLCPCWSSSFDTFQCSSSFSLDTSFSSTFPLFALSSQMRWQCWAFWTDHRKQVVTCQISKYRPDLINVKESSTSCPTGKYRPVKFILGIRRQIFPLKMFWMRTRIWTELCCWDKQWWKCEMFGHKDLTFSVASGKFPWRMCERGRTPMQKAM